MFIAHLLLHNVPSSAALPYHLANPGKLDHRAFSEPRHRRHALRLSSVAAQTLLATEAYATPQPRRVVYPTEYGADPTGVADSTASFVDAIAAVVALGGPTDAQHRIDLGGATLDLGGGVYSVSSQVHFPPGYANFAIKSGSLVARANFTSIPSGAPSWKTDTAYVFRIGGTSCNSTSGGESNKNCNSDVSVQELTIDGGNIAFGGLLVEDTMNVNVGPAVYVVGFQGVGISLAGTGAGYIHESWLGQWQPGSKNVIDTATAILLAGKQHDCDINNVIVWSGLVGVNTTNGANRLQGVHTWNDAGANGGTGIRLHKGNGRVEQSYLDYAPLVIGCPGTTGYSVESAMVEGNLFLGSSTIVLESELPKQAAGSENSAGSIVSNLIITNNIFHTWNRANSTFVLDETHGKFVGVVNTVVEGNEVGVNVDAIHGKLGTRATIRADVAVGAKTVAIDFDKPLLFSRSIGIASATCSLSGVFPTAISHVAKGNTVTVYLADAPTVVGTSVTCTVDQSTVTSAAH